jgi:hypothetical protein
MNDTVASLVHLYKTAADLERSEQEFQDTLGLLDSLNKPALLTLTRQMNLVLPSRISTELLRIRIRERIRNRRGMALRCEMLGY